MRHRAPAYLLGCYLLFGCSTDAAQSESDSSVGGGAAGGSGGGAGGAGDSMGGAAGGGSVSYSRLGVCGQRGEATVDRGSSFEGFEEFYLIGDEGFGSELCVVRFDTRRVGSAPVGCNEYAGQQAACLWTHLVEYSNPSIQWEQGGICGNSELSLDEAAISALDGTRAAYGFVSEYQGHNSVLMKLSPESGVWRPLANATWDPGSSSLTFDRRAGLCGYEPATDAE